MEYTYQKIGPYKYDCNSCPTRCDGKSKLNYIFENDVAVSEKIEREIIEYINRKNNYKATNSSKSGYPDIEIIDNNNEICYFFEIKFQRRTFMLVSKLLPESNLIPSETIALNLSDLIRYFEIKERVKVPIFLIWGLAERPCIDKNQNILYFHQEIDKLKDIYTIYEAKRRFRRRSGTGDVVDGVHKGVVVNYHFSLNELLQGIPKI